MNKIVEFNVLNDSKILSNNKHYLFDILKISKKNFKCVLEK
mgnify:CR=1 FL=1